MADRQAPPPAPADPELARATGTVTAWGHQFLLTEDGRYDGKGYPNGLVAPMSVGARITTGVYGGPVRCELRVRTAEPPEPTAPELAEWDEIIDVSVASEVGRLVIQPTDPLSSVSDYPPASAAGPGSYRLRVHARGRDVDTDGIADEAADEAADEDVDSTGSGSAPPPEDYLLVVWPAAAGPETVHQQRDEYGAWRRG